MRLSKTDDLPTAMTTYTTLATLPDSFTLMP